MKQLNLYEAGFTRGSRQPAYEQQPGDPPLPQLPSADQMPPPLPPSALLRSPSKSPPAQSSSMPPTSPSRSPLRQANSPAPVQEITNHQPPWDDFMAEMGAWDPPEVAPNEQEPLAAAVDVNAEQDDDSDNKPPPKKRRKSVEEITEPQKVEEKPAVVRVNNPTISDQAVNRMSESPPPPRLQPIRPDEEDSVLWKDDAEHTQMIAACPAKQELFGEFWSYIRTHTMPSAMLGAKAYNLRAVPSSTARCQIGKILRRNHRLNATGYLINFEAAFILVNKKDGRLRYYHAAESTRLFDRYALLNSQEDLCRVIRLVKDVICRPRNALHELPNLGWTIHQLANIIVKIYPIPGVGFCKKHLPPFTEHYLRLKDPRMPTAVCQNLLPSFVRHNFGLTNFITNPVNHHYIGGRMCFFKCLAMHKMTVPNPQWDVLSNWHSLKKTAEDCVNTFTRYLHYQGINGDLSNGMPLHLLDQAEKCFGYPLIVYRLKKVFNGVEEDDEDIAAGVGELHYSSRKVKLDAQLFRVPSFLDGARGECKKPSADLNVCFGEGGHVHFSYIRDFERYSRCFFCNKCSRKFHRNDVKKKHEGRCKGEKAEFITHADDD